MRATDELVARMGLAQVASHLPSQASGGQKQRCAVARAVVNEPAIVFADEPTGALNRANSLEVLDLLGLSSESRPCPRRAMSFPSKMTSPEVGASMPERQYDLLGEHNRDGISILMVTHDVRSAVRGNRLLYFEDGDIRGELEWVRRKPRSPSPRQLREAPLSRERPHR